jgi:diamine N-acetyltransferase
MTKRTSRVVRLAPVNSRRDIEKVSALAQMIWHEYFPSIIGQSDTDYLAQKLQTPLAIAEQIAEGYQYFFITENGQVVGYVSVKIDDEDLYLSKLYLAKDFRAAGRSSHVLDYFVEYCCENRLSGIRLNCNKHNVDALAVYEHWGFVRVASEKIAVGEGHYMDDYIYRLPVAPEDVIEEDHHLKRKTTVVYADAQVASPSDGDAPDKRTRKKIMLPENDQKDFSRLALEYEDDLERLPRFSLAGFLLTPIWAPAHGFLIAILLYPAWVFVDSLIRQAVEQRTVLSIGLAIIILFATIAVSAWIASSSQRNAYLRVAGKVPLKTYLMRERIWNIVSVPVAIIVVSLATYYNLIIYPTLLR